MGSERRAGVSSARGAARSVVGVASGSGVMADRWLQTGWTVGGGHPIRALERPSGRRILTRPGVVSQGETVNVWLIKRDP